ncbi:hypothetical protein T12_15594 [Trichinella patagoniensis]|uniref:Uncharacterized protein n=1 Tax=Trichinella patagoniensis TaxID=990121 RepID=A0A0V0ZAI5_9BILA|nr:hypothetical protein T12_15594 [Trichinella patagoniensis]
MRRKYFALSPEAFANIDTAAEDSLPSVTCTNGEIKTDLNYPFDVADIIIDPHSLTAIAIQNVCECCIQL